MAKVVIPVTNPFSEGGEFRILLIESKGNPQSGDLSQSLALMKPKEKKKKVIKSKVDHGQSKTELMLSAPIDSTEKLITSTNKEGIMIVFL